MIRYISDMHLLDGKCISYDNRPFGDLDSMHDSMKDIWNDTVKKDDTTYIIGDMFCANNEHMYKINDYVKQLNGSKILVPGNHDFQRPLDLTQDSGLKISQTPILRISDTLNGKRVRVILSHYPDVKRILPDDYDYFIYGHIHMFNTELKGNTKQIRFESNCLNAFCGLTNYMPVTLGELKAMNYVWRLKNLHLKM